MEKVLTFMFVLVCTITAVCPYAFSRQGTLTGHVVDGFDNPVKDVEINIKKSDFTARTDEKGQYRINFNPGKFDISFSKKGYSKHAFPLNIRETTEVPLPGLTFWKYPESGGIFLVRMDDYKKIEYTSFYSERDEKSLSFYVKGEPTKIECPEEAFEQGNLGLMLLDYSKDEPVVVGKSLYSVVDGNLVGKIGLKSEGWGVEKAEDEYSEVSSRIGIRYVTLKPGKYCYVIGQLTLRSKLGFGYYSEIVEPVQ
ncbi:MAG: carboxypeptidase regulatory-like domain-containing protein [Maribacter sp.]|nr:carboxypeptidase regulatory-like domain-containing protein [Maribacter sp.]